ncbi:hypothetical protein CPB86DRAFT_808413 [Serendipita vermifera]|nr:hypothetical protein CPB86DRAFT_808413 [Serendipita vermifera]
MALSATPSAAWLPPKGTHNITIGSSIRRSLANLHAGSPHRAQPSGNDFVAMRYNLKPPSVANATGSLMPVGGHSQRDSFQLELNAETGERHSFHARSETKKEVDCVLFYDASTGTLVLERLDSLLSLTHQRSGTKGVKNTVSTPSGILPNRPSPAAVVVPATAFPPTPPSTSPPEYSSLPESTRSKDRDSLQESPHFSKDQPSSFDLVGDRPAENEPSLSSSRSASSTASSRRAPQTMSDYAQEQRRLKELRAPPLKRSTSDFASEPDEEILTFGKPSTPSPNNALRLSDLPARRDNKRKLSDSEPDEEVLEFGRPAREIKRVKTASQSPASVSYGSPAVDTMQSDAALSPRYGQAPTPSAPLQSIPSRSSAAHVQKMVHGSSPLATAQVLSASSGSEDEDDDDSDSDDEDEAPTFVPRVENNTIEIEVGDAQVAGDADGDDEDFLLAAFGDDDDPGGMQEEGGSDDSSEDDSDYDER